MHVQGCLVDIIRGWHSDGYIDFLHWRDPWRLPPSAQAWGKHHAHQDESPQKLPGPITTFAQAFPMIEGLHVMERKERQD